MCSRCLPSEVHPPTEERDGSDNQENQKRRLGVCQDKRNIQPSSFRAEKFVNRVYHSESQEVEEDPLRCEKFWGKNPAGGSIPTIATAIAE